MPKYGNIETQAQYAVVTLANLLLSGAEWDDVIADIDEVYDQTPDPEGANNDYGDPTKWEAFMRAYPSFVFCLIRNESKIVAYWYTLPVKKALYDRGIAGENINAELANVHIEDFSVPGDYYLYLVDLFRFSGENNRAANTKLVQSFAEFLIDSYNDGFFVCGIFANTSTPWAINLCERLGFKFRCEHKQHLMESIDGGNKGTLQPTQIYSLELDESDILPYARRLLTQWVHPKGTPKLVAVEQVQALQDLLEAGEGPTVEFKSTLRANLHTLQPDERIELSALKTIAGFLNAKGGTLLIGVNDEGKVLGLSADGFPNEDRMALHLVNLIRDRLGELFLPYVHSRFKSHDGKRLLVVQSDPGPRAAFVKDGKIARFFVRGGSATTELSGTNMTDYISDRFKL